MTLHRFKSRNHPQQVWRNGARPEVDERATPPELFDPLNARFRFTIDVCALPRNAKLERFYTPDDDGLSQSWADERVWCNPPYSSMLLRTHAAALCSSTFFQIRSALPNGGRSFGRIRSASCAMKRWRPARNSTRKLSSRSRYGSTWRCHQPCSVRFAGRSITTSSAPESCALYTHGSIAEELVEKACAAVRDHVVTTGERRIIRVALEAALSSILRERDEAREALRDSTHSLSIRLEAAEGDRDRLRSLFESLRGVRGQLDTQTGLYGRDDAAKVAEYERRVPQTVEMLDVLIARAALSTGDRQDDDSHVRAAEATQPARARQDSEGGAS